MLDHPEGGDERDLVAPSDVEELEIWKKDREREKEDGSCGSQSTFNRLTEDGLPRNVSDSYNHAISLRCEYISYEAHRSG